MKRLTIAFLVCASANAQMSPLPETPNRAIEYESVTEALRALRTKPNVQISVQNGWTIVEESADHAIWSFAPDAHPAFPAVVKRKVVEKDGMVSIKTDVACEATKSNCDALVREFMQMNQDVRRELNTRALSVPMATDRP